MQQRPRSWRLPSISWLSKIKRDAGLSSRISDRVEHPAYQQVIKMGEPVLPLIFRYMDGGKGGFGSMPFVP